MKRKVFYVEDDKNMGFLLKNYLEEANFEVDLFENGLVALQNFAPANYNICLLDVMLPGLDGFSLAQKIRQISRDIPIILITARSMKSDKQYGFELNIDDYITKPFDEDEVVWKMNALLRRKDKGNDEDISNLIKIGIYTLDYKNLLLCNPTFEKRLTLKEADVLLYLSQNINVISKKEDILKKIWGSDDYFNGRSLDVFITRLRKYLSQDEEIKIETIPKVGVILKV